MFGASWKSWPTPWPQKSRTTEQRSRLGIGLDGGADVAGAGAGPDRRDAAHQAFIGDFEQALGGALDRADRIHARGIAVPAVEDVGDVDVDDVAIPQRLVVGNAVADDVVDRGAGRFRVAAIVERRRQRAVVHAELEDEAVDGFGGDAGLDHRHQLVEAARGEVACLAHAGKAFLAIEADLAGVSERCRGGVEIGDHFVRIAGRAPARRAGVKISPDLALEGKRFKEELPDTAGQLGIFASPGPMSCRFVPGLLSFLAILR